MTWTAETKPSAQILYTLADANNRLQDFPEEIQRMADEAVALARRRNSRQVTTSA